jgi:hypothetical protein
MRKQMTPLTTVSADREKRMTTGSTRPAAQFDYGALYRWFFALSIVLGTAAVLVAVLTNPPYYGSQSGVAAAIATNATSSDLMDQTHIIAEVVASYLLPLGFLAMAWLALPRAPLLATIGGAVAILGLLPLAVFAGEDSFYYDIARAGAGPAFVDMAQRFNGDGVMTYYNLMFVVGTVLAPIFIGAALWRAQVIPAWAAICLIFGRLPVLLFPVVSYHVLIIILMVGVLALFVGSIPAAVALAREGRAISFKSR